MREKWRRRRGWIKIHFAVDVETKQITAYEVTDEQTHDNKEFKDLVEKSEERARIKRVLADKAYVRQLRVSPVKEHRSCYSCKKRGYRHSKASEKREGKEAERF